MRGGGRPRIPARIHEIRGTADAEIRRRAATELTIEPGDIGEPPEWLGEYGKAEWALLANHPQYKKILSPLHHGTVLEYCILYDRMVKTEMGIAGDERLTGTERQMLHSLRLQLGITPAAAAKVKVPVAEAPKRMFDLKANATSEAG